MGIVRILQKKHTRALAYVRAAVILDPLFQPAVDVFHALKCLSKVRAIGIFPKLLFRL